jgi:outer membrane protein
MRRKLLLAIAPLLAAPLAAQAPAAQSTLTLEEAVELARRYNPTYQTQLNDRRRTGLGLRSAYARLFPTSSANMGFGWREGGKEIIAGQPTGAEFNVLTSSYSVSFGVGYDLSSILAPRQQNALLDAADARVVTQEHALRRDVTTLYFQAVQADRAADLQDTLVASQQLALNLAQAKERVGSGTPLETQDREVRLKQQQINALRAHNEAEVAVIRLFQGIGVPQPGPVTLTTELAVVEPAFTLESLLSDARTRNPTLETGRAQQRAASIGRRQAFAQYLPSLSVSTGIGGSTTEATNTPSGQSRWPFDYNRSPIGFSVGLSIPLWNAFGRENQVQQAALSASDAAQNLRSAELQMETLVTSTYLRLVTDYRAVQLQEEAAATARVALRTAQERYRVGSTSYLELSNQQDTYQQAENARLVSIYTYHQTFAALEAAVGRALR